MRDVSELVCGLEGGLCLEMAAVRMKNVGLTKMRVPANKRGLRHPHGGATISGYASYQFS